MDPSEKEKDRITTRADNLVTYAVRITLRTVMYFPRIFLFRSTITILTENVRGRRSYKGKQQYI